MKLLAIETSCDETAVAVLEAEGTPESATFRVCGNALYSQAAKHSAFGGVYPSLAKREHAENLVPLIHTALTEARLRNDEPQRLSSADTAFLRDLLVREEALARALIQYTREHGAPQVDAIAVTQGPGLEPALWVGINFARALAHLWNLPIIPVNHLEGHIIASAVRTAGERHYRIEAIAFPILGLILSGGHTEFVHATSWGEYRVIGATRDDSIGEAFDKVARLLGLPYPGGPALSACAEKARARMRAHLPGAVKMKPFPRPMLRSPDLDFSFSGLKTAVLYFVRDQTELSEELCNTIAAGDPGWRPQGLSGRDAAR